MVGGQKITVTSDLLCSKQAIPTPSLRFSYRNVPYSTFFSVSRSSDHPFAFFPTSAKKKTKHKSLKGFVSLAKGLVGLSPAREVSFVLSANSVMVTIHCGRFNVPSLLCIITLLQLPT